MIIRLIHNRKLLHYMVFSFITYIFLYYMQTGNVSKHIVFREIDDT